MADFNSRKLFVGGIPRDTPENVLVDYFSRYGEVLSLTIVKDRVSDLSRGFGFVVFADSASANKALAEQHEICGRKVEVKKAIPRSENRHGGSTVSNTSTNGDNQCRTKKIFVGGLPANLTEEEFKGYFERFGSITDVVVMHDNMSNRPRGFGFVTFESEDSVEAILKDSFYEIAGKQVEVKRAIPRDQCRNISYDQMSWVSSYNHWPQCVQYGYNSFYGAGSMAGYGMPVVATVNPWNGFQAAGYVVLAYNSGPVYHMNGVYGSGEAGVQKGNVSSGVQHSNVHIREIV